MKRQETRQDFAQLLISIFGIKGVVYLRRVTLPEEDDRELDDEVVPEFLVPENEPPPFHDLGVELL